MTTFNDPQTWIFPPLGAAILPSTASASFGPISNGDSIKLEWAPASQKPNIAMICANDGVTYTLAEKGQNSSPYTYTFNQTLSNGGSHVCWIFFPGTQLGNTLTFNYYNTPISSPQTWQQSPQIAAALSGNAVTITQTETSTITQTTGAFSGTAVAGSGSVETLTFTTTLLATAMGYTTTITSGTATTVSTGLSILAASDTTSPDTAAQSTSLSAGASAGIAVGATVVLALLLLIGFLIFRRLKKDREEDRAIATSQAAATGGQSGVSSAVPAGSGPVPTAAGRGPMQLPPDQKYTPPMSHIGQPPPGGYYQPQQQPINLGRTVHEIQG